MNSQNYIFLGYGLSEVMKFFFLQIFEAYITFEFFLKTGGSVCPKRSCNIKKTSPFRCSFSLRKVLTKLAIAQLAVYGVPPFAR